MYGTVALELHQLQTPHGVKLLQIKDHIIIIILGISQDSRSM